MAINVNIEEPQGQQQEVKNKMKMSLVARKTLDGNIMLLDHPDIDIVIMPEDMKVVAFPKGAMDDNIYSVQSRMFDFLIKKGVILRETVRGGNVYGSLEGVIPPPKQKVSIDELMVMTLGKFIEQERPAFLYQKAVEDQEQERLLEPDPEDSTEFGEIPHKAEKGSIIPHQVRRYIQSF